ncbi:glycosyltransferase [uncultured Psychrobacter sp.]|uniref:glycosyltransferase n=1 Tax=uncultured Psychrobacter sp. TaxID=259303 RepID=UPI00262AF988|nr:glycosyltransferase [uncultured Psychrobacter sp.]
MKILYVITGLGQGGAERVVCELADKMYEKGHEVKIAYLTGKVLTRPDHNDIALIEVGLVNAFTLPKAYIKLSNIIREYQPDVVHAHMIHANIFSRLIRATTPIKKLICTAHSSNEGGILRMIAYRATDRLADLTTNVSETAVTAYENKYAVPKNLMKKVYNGVNFNNFKYESSAKLEIRDELNLSAHKKIILAVGRLNEAKNYPNLLRAISYLKKITQVDFVLLVAGEGELRNKIEELICELKLSNDVLLLGNRTDVTKLMSACDVFVLSSDYEGLPTVLIEALFCQANVVATEVSGVHEIVGTNGYIVPIKQPKVLAKFIANSLKNNKKNTSGYEYVNSKFNLDLIVNQWTELYECNAL